MKSVIKTFKFYSDVVLHYSNWWDVFSSRVSHTPLSKLHLRNGPTIYGDKDSQLLAITDENFFEKVYFGGPMHISKGDTVVDIGGNIGITTVLAATLGAARIFTYEPFPANVSLIKQNVQRNSVKGVVIFQQAVSDKKGSAKLYLGHHNAGHLLFNRNNVGKLHDFIEVPTTTLNAIFSENDLKKVDFLKIDCEGSEGAIFKSTSPAIWKKVKQVAVEYHDNVSVLKHQELARHLQQLGFQTKIQEIGSGEFGYVYGWKTQI